MSSLDNLQTQVNDSNAKSNAESNAESDPVAVADRNTNSGCNTTAWELEDHRVKYRSVDDTGVV